MTTTASENVGAVKLVVRDGLALRFSGRPYLAYDEAIELLLSLGESRYAVRDRALYATAYFARLPLNKTVALTVEDLVVDHHDLLVSTSGDFRRMHFRGDRACPTLALQRWLVTSRITRGPLFRKMESGRLLSTVMTSFDARERLATALQRIGIERRIHELTNIARRA